jgi:hypothetical protein
MASLPQQFADWSAMTREETLFDVNKVVNAAQKYQQYFIGLMLRANPKKEVVKGGKYISERIKLGRLNTYGRYVPGQQRQNLGRASVHQTVIFPYNYSESYTPWSEADIELNPGDQRLLVFKNFREQLRREGLEDHLNGLEDDLWTVPVNATMETTGQVQRGDPFSIPCFITENDGGSDTYRPPGWGSGTLAGVNPDNWDTWRNVIERFNDASPGDVHSGLFATFQTICRQIRFLPVAGQLPNQRVNDALEPEDFNACVIATTGAGQDLFSELLRDGNDSFRAGPQDPSYAEPQFKGKPVTWATALDTALLDEVTGVYQNQAYPESKPRFFFINARHLRIVFHRAKFMTPTEPKDGGMFIPDGWAQFWQSWHNLVCTDRRKQAIAAPLSAA